MANDPIVHDYATWHDREERHWWFRSRRRLIAKGLASLQLPAAARILDIGCRYGENFSVLTPHGQLSALEPDPTVVTVTQRLHPEVDVRCGSLPDSPFSGERFHLVTAFDVLEHIDDDLEAVRAMRSLLTPDGVCFLTVPALNCLWGPMDDIDHRRRYDKVSLRRVLEAAGLRIVRLGYFSAFLLPLFFAARTYQRLTGRSIPETDLPSPPVNALLAWIFAQERHFVPWPLFPLGASALAVARPVQARGI